MLLLSDVRLRPTPTFLSEPPSEMRAPPFFKISSIKSEMLTLVEATASDGICVNLGINQCLVVLTVAPFLCWWWASCLLLQSSCFTSGGSTPAPKPYLETPDLPSQLLNSLDLDQTTNKQVSSFAINTALKLDFLCPCQCTILIWINLW